LISGGDDNRYTYNRTRLGYYGRVTYNYQEKYLAEFLWRSDGSSFFHEDHRFGFFPGFLVGWNISNENFFANVDFISRLKLRASYGTMGSDQVYYNDVLQEYAYLSSYRGGSYPINSQVVTTLTEGVVANENFTWERAKNSNIGIDGAILQNRLDFTFDTSSTNVIRMLIQKQVLLHINRDADASTVNCGEMENKGFEFTLGLQR
jgi:hypothetical protein